MTVTPHGSWHVKRMLFALLLAAAGVSVAAAAAPGPPQTLVASVSGNTVTLTWSPSSTGGVPSNYLVQVALVAGGAAVTSLPVPASPLVVPNVPNGVYFVRVVALNADGASPPSNEVTGGGAGQHVFFTAEPAAHPDRQRDGQSRDPQLESLSGGVSGHRVCRARGLDLRSERRRQRTRGRRHVPGRWRAGGELLRASPGDQRLRGQRRVERGARDRRHRVSAAAVESRPADANDRGQ